MAVRIVNQSPAVPVSVVTGNTSLRPTARATFCLMLDRVARDSATGSTIPQTRLRSHAASAMSNATVVPPSMPTLTLAATGQLKTFPIHFDQPKL